MAGCGGGGNDGLTGPDLLVAACVAVAIADAAAAAAVVAAVGKGRDGCESTGSCVVVDRRLVRVAIHGVVWAVCVVCGVLVWVRKLLLFLFFVVCSGAAGLCGAVGFRVDNKRDVHLNPLCSYRLHSFNSCFLAVRSRCKQTFRLLTNHQECRQT